MLFPHAKGLAGLSATRHNFRQVAHPSSRCSQGGVKIPTGGKGEVAQARERLHCLGASGWKFLTKKGQQIRCDSEADGHSPDERERLRKVPRVLRVAVSFRVP
jgi:hypothetical protein